MRDLNPHEMKAGRILGPSKSLNTNKSVSTPHRFPNPSDGLSFDHQDVSHKSKNSAAFDTMASEADTLRLEDIERIKYDLNEEKNKIKFQENRLNKLIKRFKMKEDEIDEEKRYIQKRKDELTIQERSLLEEKKKFSDLQKKFKEDKMNYDQQKEVIMSDIDDVRQNIIIARSKNSIHEKKMAEYMKKIMELNNRKEYILSIYSGASNNSLNTSEHPSIHKYDENYPGAKPSHERMRSTGYQENHPGANPPTSQHRKTASKDAMIMQINMEKEKIDTMEKDLENLKHLEEQLMQELAERQHKKKTAMYNNQIQQHPVIQDTPSHSHHHTQVYTIEKGGTMVYKDHSHPNVKYAHSNPNLMMSNDFALPQKSRQNTDKDSRSSSTKIYQLPTANMSISSTHSSNQDIGARDIASAKFKKKRSSGLNVNDFMNKMDENHE